MHLHVSVCVVCAVFDKAMLLKLRDVLVERHGADAVVRANCV